MRLVLGVTGQQGFLLGRGNQQIDAVTYPRARAATGLIVLATEDKLAALSQPRLLVDTGDPALGRGTGRVHPGPNRRGREMMMRIDFVLISVVRYANICANLKGAPE